MIHCQISDCSNPALARGWCDKHYRRWRAHGDPSIVKKTPQGEPMRFFLEVVLAYDGDQCLAWPYATAKGYGTILADGRMQVVSRLVCERVNGRPPTPEHDAAHSCGHGRSACVTKRHLSWKTRTENMADTVAHGTRLSGERHGGAKLTAADIQQIRLLGGKETQAAIAGRFGVSGTTIWNILNGQRWQSVGHS